MKTIYVTEDSNEADVFWDAFDEMWPKDASGSLIEVIDEDPKDYCLHKEIDDFVIEKIAEVLKECNHNRTHTAAKLGIKRETLLAKMKKYCLL